MPARPGLPVTLHVRGRRAVLVGDGALVDERRSRLEAAGAVVVVLPPSECRAEALEGAELVLCLDPDLGTQVAALRPHDALIYVQDRPDLSDFSMPALARRLREELERLLATGGAALDNLLDEMARLREAGDRERLGPTAARLRISGRIEVDP